MEPSAYERMYEIEETHWWYRVRRKLVHRLIKKYTQARTHITRDTRILDLGSGAGLLLKELSGYTQSVGIDSSSLAVEFCKRRGTQVVLGDATHIPLADNSLDVVLALDVLEHVEKDIEAVVEIKRVLKPSGVAIIFVPATKALWSLADVEAHHFRRYSLNQLETLLMGSDFEVLKSGYFNFLLFPAIYFSRLVFKLIKKPLSHKDEARIPNKLINNLLYLIFSLDTLLFRFISYPIGVSCMAVALKKK